MAQIDLFYSLTTGTTEAVEAIQKTLGGTSVVALHEIADATI